MSWPIFKCHQKSGGGVGTKETPIPIIASAPITPRCSREMLAIHWSRKRVFERKTGIKRNTYPSFSLISDSVKKYFIQHKFRCDGPMRRNMVWSLRMILTFMKYIERKVNLGECINWSFYTLLG